MMDHLRFWWVWHVRMRLCCWGLVSCSAHPGEVDATWLLIRWDGPLTAPWPFTSGVLPVGWNKVWLHPGEKVLMADQARSGEWTDG